jgi:hypothetical protein
MSYELSLLHLERRAAQLRAFATEYNQHNKSFAAFLDGKRAARSNSEVDELVRKLRQR